MSEQQEQVATLQRPATDDRGEWKAYWEAQGMLWRTEPEIDEERQRYLTERRVVRPSIEKCTYPFRDEDGSIKLARADVEWLLATHESGGKRGPVEWNDETQRERKGLDLRGADLRDTDLSALPLARLYAGFDVDTWAYTSVRKIDAGDAQAHLEGANLQSAHLEGAYLIKAHLEGTEMRGAYLQEAEADEAHFEGADLYEAHLQHIGLVDAHMEGSLIAGANMTEADLSGAHMEGAILGRANLKNATLSEARLHGTMLSSAHMEGANLTSAHLEGASILAEDLNRITHWVREGTLVLALRNWKRFPERLPPADLSSAFLDSTTDLTFACLGDRLGYISVADVRWSDTNLAVVDWQEAGLLGDERHAQEAHPLDDDRIATQTAGLNDRDRDRVARRLVLQEAVRANRQLAAVLRAQGLNEESDRFAYRAQVCQRLVLRDQAFFQIKDQHRGPWWRARRLTSYLGSSLLDLISGYGYKPIRSVITYVLIICAFTGAYLLNAQFAAPHLTWDEALVLSISAFHGRGFFTSGISLGDTLARLAAGEAIIGLLIEITFIATFTQRFFAR